jgi:hypothetical protein
MIPDTFPFRIAQPKFNTYSQSSHTNNFEMVLIIRLPASRGKDTGTTRAAFVIAANSGSPPRAQWPTSGWAAP